MEQYLNGPKHFTRLIKGITRFKFVLLCHCSACVANGSTGAVDLSRK